MHGTIRAPGQPPRVQSSAKSAPGPHWPIRGESALQAVATPSGESGLPPGCGHPVRGESGLQPPGCGHPVKGELAFRPWSPRQETQACRLRSPGGAGLTLACGEQGCDGALVPHGDQQCPGEHDEHDGEDVPSLRHLQGWLGPQLLVSWAAAAEGEKHTSGPGGPGTGPRGAARQPTGLTAQPTHCRRSSAESSPTGVWEGVLSAVGQEPCGVNTCKRGQRGWPEAWGAAPWGRGQAVPPRSRHPCLGSPGLPPGPFMKRAPSFQGFNARGPCSLPLGGHRECSG